MRCWSQRGLDLELIVAGDGVEREAVARIIEQGYLPGVVMRGGVLEADKAALYASADLFCAPSLFGESFGIVLVEAMASGLPVVAAANSGYRRVLAQVAEDCLVTPGDAVSLAAKLRALVRSPARRKCLAQWGIAEARRYDCQAWIETIEAAYAEAMASRARIRRNG